MEVHEVIGKRFGKLVVKQDLGIRKRGKKGRRYYQCDCDCGQTVVKEASNLLSGHTKSCGCLRRLRGAENKGWTGCGGIPGRLWSQILNHAKSRGLVCEITIEEAWRQFQVQQGRCSLTGLPIAMPKGSKKNYQHTASLDRIDSCLGYTTGNIQWVHKEINRMKLDMPQERFCELCRLVANNCA